MKVFYLDYGNSENVSKASLRELTKKFAELPAQALCCSVKGLSQSRDEESLSKFKQMYIFSDVSGEYFGFQVF